MTTFGTDKRAFIRHNVLTLHADLDYPTPQMLRSDGTVLVELVDITDTYGNDETAPWRGVHRNRNRRGLARLMPKWNESWWTKTTAIYQVRPAASVTSNDAFAAYICPYADNSVQTKMLGNDADIMFTGDMDGCTFGVGIPNGLGGVRVGHSNQQNQAVGHQFNQNFAPQRAAQLQDLQNNNVGSAIVNPDVYRPNPARLGSENKAVTIGLRINGTWEFWYQHQNVDGGDFRDKLATTRIG